MPLIVPDVGEVVLLEAIRTLLNTPASYSLALFQSNTTPTQSSVYGDFTLANFSGYGAATFSDWNAVSTVSNKAKMVTAAQKTFSHNGGATSNTIYGYLYYKISGTVILWAERFTNPITMAASGDVIAVTPAFTLNSEN